MKYGLEIQQNVSGNCRIMSFNHNRVMNAISKQYYILDKCLRTLLYFYMVRLGGSMINQVTVLIPTYNRRDQLKNTLNSLYVQTRKDFKILILDNSSNYDINELIGYFPKDYQQKIKCVKKQINTGGAINCVEIFELCDTQWAWTLSDDEYVHRDAIEKIYRRIDDQPNAGCFNFSICSGLVFDNNSSIILRSLDDFIAFYSRLKCYYHGDLIFLSNKVYNMDLVRNFLTDAFVYSYAFLPPVIIISRLLQNNNIFTCVREHIVEHNQDSERSWNICSIVQATRILSDIKYKGITSKQRKALLRIQSFDIDMIYYFYFLNGAITDNQKHFFDQIYHGLYKYALPLNQRIMMKMVVFFTKIDLGYRIIRKMMMVGRKIKRCFGNKREDG